MLAGPAEATFVPHKRTKLGSTNLPEGTVHIFRDAQNRPSQEELEAIAPSASVTADNDTEGIILAVLAVPSWLTPSDFLAFVAPAAESMTHLRIIR